MTRDIVAVVIGEAEALEAHCRQRLAVSCLSLARHLAGKWWAGRHGWPPGVDLGDLEGELLMALVKASRGFDPRRGFRFTSYCYSAMTRRACTLRRDWWRRHALERSVDYPLHVVPCQGDAPGRGIERREAAELASRLLLAVASERRRDAAWRVLTEEATPREVAAERGVSMQAVLSQVSAAVAEMRRALDDG